MNAHRPAGQVRIIGGRLRGSKLPVPDLPGLRPSGDRARETLFNWLQGEIAGARVLDLFAGSGVLGLEAASRGAAEVWLVERDPAQARSLAASVARLHAGTVQVACADALAWLSTRSERFDLAFLDPPFGTQLLAPAVAALLPRLAPQAWVHVEVPRDAAFTAPPHWRLHREGATREARHLLLRAETPDPAATLAGSLPGAGNDQA